MNAPVVSSLDFSSSSDSASLLSMDTMGDCMLPSNETESTDSVLKYISQVLMEEEDMEESPCIFHDASALQATEKSLYEVLGEKIPPAEQPQISRCAYESAENLEDSGAFSDQINSGRSDYQNSSSNDGDGVLGCSVSELVNPYSFLQNEWTLQFNKGVQEASKFLPNLNHLSTATENIASASELKEMASGTGVRAELEEGELASSNLTGKKNYEKGGVEELEEGELFDKLLLCSVLKEHPSTFICYQSLQKSASKTSEQKGQTNGSSGRKARTKKKRDMKEVIDLRTLLIFCAQALSTNDLRTANEHLKQIRQHSSSSGDGYQRLAHVFADALEARIAGTGNQIYTFMSSKQQSAADILKTHQLNLSACPFQRSAIYFANRSILSCVKEKKATTLHIIDFGISYGFQWPSLIMRLQQIHGDPPNLRITGIDLPMRGFRPTEAIRETGRRLARYCEKFNVPFEYNVIAQKWETIQVEDLKLRSNEVVVVNCLYRLHHLLEDTVVGNNPRDTVLNLIREINPDMFIHSIVNGSFRTPFFLTRFRNVLFHNSALFDMLDSRIAREDEVRSTFELDILGREVMNVVACEGAERIERPESYKQWQVRTTRARFRQRGLDHEVLNKLRGWVKAEFRDHDDFTVENDGEWMLQGWKGRILFASSIWLPA